MAVSSTTVVYVLISIAIALVSFAIMGLFSTSNKFPVDGKVSQTSLHLAELADRLQTVVVTGGSQGFGLSVAKKLAQKGANVVIVAQNVTKLENAVKEISVSSRFLSSTTLF